jgi:UDP-arabinose 4-epimerase
MIIGAFGWVSGRPGSRARLHCGVAASAEHTTAFVLKTSRLAHHACKALSAAGLTPVAFDNLVSGHDWAVKWGPLERGDILDRPRLDEVLQKYRPSAVMHFAAYAFVGESVEQPAKYYRNNVAGTLTLLEAMYDHGVKQVVFSSSCAAYGIPQAIPIREDHPQNPINAYGASKLMVERILADFGAAYGLRSISLRYFNAAGADPDGEIGEDHDPETHLIPLVLETALGQRPNVTIYRTDYDTPDGTCIRDFVHVTDLADAHVLALKALQGNGKTANYNLGIGSGFSVKEVIKTARAVTKGAITVKEGPRRPGDPPRLVADATRAKNELGWTPKYDDLNKIIPTAWHWSRKRRPAVADPYLNKTSASQVDSSEPRS